MLKFIDKVLTKMIDWLHLKRAKVRLTLEVQASENGGQYEYPLRQETINRRLNEFGISVEQLNSASAMGRARNIDAMMQG